MPVILKKMETDDEIRGKAYVHYQAWHEAYQGIIDQDYLDGLSLEKCIKLAYDWPDNVIIAKDNNDVVGFISYGHRSDLPFDTGEIIALYVLSDHYGHGLGSQLMDAGLKQMSAYNTICLRVLKNNIRAIRFYTKYGFYPVGTEHFNPVISASEIRMFLNKSL